MKRYTRIGVHLESSLDDEWVRYEDAEAAIKAAVVEAFQAGYARGHNDTVEGCYNGSIEEESDAALEWLSDRGEK